MIGRKIGLLVSVALCLPLTPAFAVAPVTPAPLVVSSCGSKSYVAGQFDNGTMDLAGNECATIVWPKSGTADRVVTKTNLSLNTSAQICPTATNPMATEIFFTTAGVGISLAGGTLTQAAVGTTATTTPDLFFNAANLDYLAPAGITNAITAYGAAGIVTCVQWLKP